MSNLLEKASIVTTPTAYNDGKLLSVKPEPSLGSELVTNGTFDTDLSGWLVTDSATGIDITWTVNGVSFITDGTGGGIQQSVLTVGKSYLVEFDYTAISGAIKMLPYFTDISETKRYSKYITATTTSISFYRKQGNTEGLIDNVSVKEAIDGDFDFTRNSSATRVASNGLIEDVQILSGNLVTNGDFSDGSTGWTLGTGWSIVDGVAISDSVSSNSNLVTTSSFYSGVKQVKMSISVTDYVSGTLKLYLSTIPFAEITSNGDFTFYTTADRSDGKMYLKAGNFNASITNISVIEITDDTNLPRIDYTDGVGHILLEPQSTNLVTYSEDYGSGKYFSITSGSTIDNTTSLSPSGENNATQLTSTGAGKLQTGGVSLSQNTDYILSFYAKNVDATDVTSRILGTGGSGGSNLTQVSYFSQLSTTQWKRITHSFNTGTNTTFFLYLSNALNSGGTIQLWGAQLEQLSFATSYIPTSGSTVTRLGETLNNAGSSDLINSTEGVLYAEISALANENLQRVLSISDGTHDNCVKLGLLNSATDYRFFLDVRLAGVNQAFLTFNFGAVAPTFKKCAIKYKQNNFALWIDGVEVATDTSGNTFSTDTLNELSFDRGGGPQDFYGKTKCVAVYKEALTDAELTCLTTI